MNLNMMRKQKTIVKWSVWIIFGILAAYSFFTLNQTGLWYDEILSIWFSHPDISLQDLYIERMATDTAPPLYYILLHFWLGITSIDEFHVRLFSWIIYFVGFVSVGFSARLIFSKTEALLITGFIFCCGFMLLYSQIARFYVLLVPLSAIMTFMALRLIKEIKAKGDFPTLLFYGYLFFAILGCYTHIFAAFLFFIQGVTLFYFSIVNKNNVMRVIIGGLSAFILYLPCLYIMTYTNSIRLDGGMYLDSSFLSIFPFLMRLLFGNLWLGLSFIFLIVIGVILSKFNNRKTLPLFFWIALFWLLAFILFTQIIALKYAVLTARNYAVLLPCFAIIMFYTLQILMPIKYTNIAVLLLIIELSLFASTSRHISDEFEEIRGAAIYISEIEECDGAYFYLYPVKWSRGYEFIYYLNEMGMDISHVTSTSASNYEEINDIMVSQSCPIILWSLRRDASMSEEVLAELGYDIDELDIFRNNGNIIYHRSEN